MDLRFHAQQVAEKALKAWLSGLGQPYPKTHDLKLLLDLLEAAREDVSPWRPAVALNAFAVQLRYDTPDVTDDPVDRPQTIRQLGGLLAHVRSAGK
ncbi:MAG: HEPN domain-containing protein [Deltaproteobacteria bacterium]